MGRPYAELIGDPVAHSRSPEIHGFWLKALGIDAEYRLCRVQPEKLEDYLAERRNDPDWCGCNVTMPHKEKIIGLLDTISRSAGKVGAVNTVRRGEDGRLHGRNTDIQGVWDSLGTPPRRLLVPKRMRVVLIGAGGAARAAAYAIARMDYDQITVINRTIERAERLVADFRLRGTATSRLEIPASDLVINAAPSAPDYDLSNLATHSLVFDLVYEPLETRLLAAARPRGLRTIDGLTMLVNQAKEAFATLFGTPVPLGHGRRLRESLLA